MTKQLGAAVLVLFGFFAICEGSNAANSDVPEPFQGFDDSSEYTIDYNDLTALLKIVVVDVGLSMRREAREAPEITGTRMKPKVKKTANEGNRFYFETFEDNEESQVFLRDIQDSLERLPAEVPLSYFSRDEQLAYWLNLYNVTVLNEIIAVYPKKNLKKLVTGKKSIFARKLLMVAGVPLSLDDIQFTILRQNYDNNPLIIYGLYKGIIGGPNIRKSAYTGADVHRALETNAYEFVNSNRGTYIRDEKTFRVSSLYARDGVYFPDFDSDLSQHLLQYLQGKEKPALQAASKIKPDINDWAVTDLGGSNQRIGGSFGDSRAALMDSVRGTTPEHTAQPMTGGGSAMSVTDGYGSTLMTAGGQQRSLARIDPALLQVLHDLNEGRLAENQRSATVEIQDLEDSPAESAPDVAPDEEGQ